MPNKSPRREVYLALDGERVYQSTKWTELDEINNVGDFLLYMKQQLDKAMTAYGGPGRDSEALHQIRKVTAVGVACMEKHGALKREGF